MTLLLTSPWPNKCITGIFRQTFINPIYYSNVIPHNLRNSQVLSLFKSGLLPLLTSQWWLIWIVRFSCIFWSYLCSLSFLNWSFSFFLVILFTFYSISLFLWLFACSCPLSFSFDVWIRVPFSGPLGLFGVSPFAQM